jgi:hypothetical protein
MILQIMRTTRSLTLSLKISGEEWRIYSYPYDRILVRSDKVMKFGEPYMVKRILFKITKSNNAYLSTLPSRLLCRYGSSDAFKHIAGCYLFLGEKLK